MTGTFNKCRGHCGSGSSWPAAALENTGKHFPLPAGCHGPSNPHNGIQYGLKTESLVVVGLSLALGTVFEGMEELGGQAGEYREKLEGCWGRKKISL